MAFSAVSLVQSLQFSSARTSITFTMGQTIPVGTMLTGFIVLDSVGAFIPELENGYVDGKGNFWTRGITNRVSLPSISAGSGTDGVNILPFICLVTSQLISTDTVTFNFSIFSGSTELPYSATDSLGLLMRATYDHVTKDIHNITTESSQAGGTSISATISNSTSRQYLQIGYYGSEGEDTAKTPTTGFTELADVVSTTAGAAAANVAGHLQFRVSTTGVAMTASVSASTATYHAFLFSAFYELDKNLPPTTTLISPNDGAIVSTTPTLSFSATDPELNEVGYNVQIYRKYEGTLLETLQDDFTDNSINTALWQADALNGTVVEEVQALNLTVNANSAGGYAQLFSANAGTRTFYNLTGKDVVVNVIPNGSATNLDTYLEIHVDANNKVWFNHRNGQIYAQLRIAGINSALFGVTNFIGGTHNWWRIRESSGTLFWDYSSNGAEWTNMYSTSNPFSLTSVSPGLIVFQNISEGVTRTSQFDNFGIVPNLIVEQGTSGSSSGFTGSPDNFSPYPSGQTVSYTVQNPLTTGLTYYWSARAVDFFGSATYGDFAAERSFIIQVQNQTYEETISLTQSNLLISLATAILQANSSLDSNHQLSVFVQLIKDESIVLISNHSLNSALVAILNLFSSITSINQISTATTLIAEVAASVSLTADTAYSTSLLMELLSSISSDSELAATAGLLYELNSLLSSQSQTSVDIQLLLDAVVSFVSQNDITSSASLSVDAQSILSSLNLIDAQSNLTINGQSSISSDHQQESVGNILMSPSSSLESGADINSVVGLLLDLVSNMQSSSQLDVNGNLIVSMLSSLSSGSDIQTSGSLIIEGSLDVSAGADTDPFPTSSLVGAINLISQHLLTVLQDSEVEYSALLSALNQLQAQSEGVLENLIVVSSVNDLQALAQIVQELSSSLDASSQLTASLLSDFIEQVSINSSASIDVNLVLEYLNFIGVNADSDVSAAIQSEINQIISLLINSAISAVDELVQGGQTYEESISIQSIALLLVNSQIPSHTLTLIGVSVIRFISKLK